MKNPVDLSITDDTLALIAKAVQSPRLRDAEGRGDPSSNKQVMDCRAALNDGASFAIAVGCALHSSRVVL